MDEQEIEHLEKLKKIWYESEPVLFEIIKNLNGREMMFIGSSKIRNMKAYAIRYLLLNFKSFNFIERKFNLYNSLALFYNFPTISFNFVQRKIEEEKLREEYMKYLVGYDFLFDVDCKPEPKFSYAVAYKIKEIFDKYKIKYYILASAGKNNGFHIRISYKDLPLEYKKMSYVKLCDLFKRFTIKFMNNYNLPFIDDTIMDLRRVAKCPYGVVYPYYNLALPLSDEEFNNFEPEKISLQYWINHVDKIKNRGLLKREGNPENFKKLIKDTLKE